ncbi:porin family protein [Urechidicola croceus]|uniref:Outer membrane protein beta-barrel domain-containing protein n=1 Tax=Urechidicola croceus TaxID=1850246 RepID=A0A1D8P8Z2_9FLAO|nr:outer membrane beta-barrel protein [Urechidicola croceus]AOW21037.1 hypothetical protein LPB138_10250 [Urechidicola croceus]
MKTNKNIDRLFQEKLKDFEVSPPDDAWKNIEQSLNKNKKRPIIPLWFKLGGVAAILLLMTIGTINYYNNPTEVNPIITDIDGVNKTTPVIENIEIENQIDSNNEDAIVNSVNNDDINSVNTTISSEQKNQEKSKQEKVVITNETSTVAQKSTSKNSQLTLPLKRSSNKTTDNTAIAINNSDNNTNLLQKQNSITSNSIENTINTNSTRLNENNANKSSISDPKISQNNTNESAVKVEDDIEENEDVIAENIENLVDTLDENELLKQDKEDEKNTKKWSVASIAGPVQLNSFSSDSSPLDESFIQNEKQVNNAISYGIKVGYKLNNKLSLQSGISIVNLSYKTNDVLIQTNLNASHLSSINYAPNAELIQVSGTSSSNSDALNSSARNEVSNVDSFTGTLNQEFGYIEVPLELKYNLTDGKIGVNLVGGFSTLFLNDNTITVDTDSFSSTIGEADNLNNINFSGNFGLDVDYKINKQLFLNIAPTIKVQTNTFSNNSGNFKPYTIGVYTGLNYSF